MNSRFLACTPLSFFALFLAAPAIAADVKHWQIDDGKSRLGFSGSQAGLAFDGRFKTYSASISFDPDNLGASRITVDIDIASAVTGDAQRDAALPGKEWFDTANFPRATFQTTEIRKTGEGYEAAGVITIRGIKQPLTLPFSLKIDGDVAHAHGQTSIKRTLFGVGQGSWATNQVVGFNVNVDLDIFATRAR
jgi:polyisoprenoid-binding protein YceI